MCYSSVFEACEDFVLPVPIPYRHRFGEARDHGKKEKQSKSLAWWVSCMSWKSMLHKMSFCCPWNSLKNRSGLKNLVWQTKMRWMNFVCLFLLCGQAGESRPQIFCSPGVQFLCLCLVFHQLSLPEMLKCFILLLSSFCNCQHLLIFLGLFSFVRKRTWIKLSMHDIY